MPNTPRVSHSDLAMGVDDVERSGNEVHVHQQDQRSIHQHLHQHAYDQRSMQVQVGMDPTTVIQHVQVLERNAQSAVSEAQQFAMQVQSEAQTGFFLLHVLFDLKVQSLLNKKT